METNSTINRTVTATIPVALHAITGHMLDHRLPAPHDIDTRGVRDRGIHMWFYSHEVDAWLASGFVEADRQVRTPAELSRTFEIVDVDGTLPTPVGDIRVRFTFVQPSTGRLLQLIGVAL